MDALHLIVGGGGTLLLFLIGVVWQVVSGRIAAQATEAQAIREAMHAFQLKVAETYPSKETLRDMLQPIMDELQKIDRKLDGKMDKE